jgi:hypothetical protein
MAGGEGEKADTSIRITYSDWKCAVTAPKLAG